MSRTTGEDGSRRGGSPDDGSRGDGSRGDGSPGDGSRRERAGHAARRAALLGQRTIAGFLQDRGAQLAASIAYYALFATFPLAICMVALFGIVAADDQARQEVIDFLMTHLPLREDSGRRDIADSLEQVTGDAGTFGVIGVAGLMFSASGLMGALRHALNRAWAVDDRRPALAGKLLDILLVLGVGVVIGLSLALTLTTRLAVDAAQELSDAIGPALSFLPRIVFALGQITPVALSFALFLALYRFLPARPGGRLRDCVPGALIGALLYEAVKTGFAFYLENVASYGAVYGPIATVIAFLFFVFLASIAFLLGAEAAAAWPGVRDGPLDEGSDEPIGVRARRVLRGLVVNDE